MSQDALQDASLDALKANKEIVKQIRQRLNSVWREINNLQLQIFDRQTILYDQQLQINTYQKLEVLKRQLDDDLQMLVDANRHTADLCRQHELANRSNEIDRAGTKSI